MDAVEIFNTFTQEYDEWFDRHKLAYESEVMALKGFIPEDRQGLEVGVGTGRFAIPLGIKEGIEPAKAMAEIARKLGVNVIDGTAEELPFDDKSFDFVLFVSTLCFLQEPLIALKEADRVLVHGGQIIIGMIDKNSPLGQAYESTKNDSTFYSAARFHSVEQVLDWLMDLNYNNINISQTIFEKPEYMFKIAPIKEGYGEGGFAVISAQKEVL